MRRHSTEKRLRVTGMENGERVRDGKRKSRSARQEREGDKPGRAPVTLKQSLMVLI